MLPVGAVVAGTVLAAVTAGSSVAAMGTTTGLYLSASAAAGLAALGLTEAVAIALVVASVTASAAIAGMMVKAIAENASPDHISIKSMGWYFGGTNKLEIRGGVELAAMAKSQDPSVYRGSPLYIVDTADETRRS